jgi:hypothetical protein
MPGAGQAGSIKMAMKGFNDFGGCTSFTYNPPEAFDEIRCSISKVDTIDGTYKASLSKSTPAAGDSVTVCAELADHVYETHAGAKDLKVAEVTVSGKKAGSSDIVDYLRFDVTMDVPYCARAISGLTGDSLGSVAFVNLQAGFIQEIGRASSVPGYVFVEWTGLAVDLGCVPHPTSPDLFVNVYRYFITEGMTTQCRVVANYAVPGHTLIVSSTEGGSVTKPGEGSYPCPDGAVSIVATAEQGYEFTGWSGTAVTAGKVANSSASSTTVTMGGDYTLVANFARISRILSISSTQGGSVTAPGEGTFSYAVGSSVSIVAVAATNHRFTGWTGTAVSAGKVANPHAASTTVTVDAAYTLVANFESTAPTIVRHTLTVSSGDGGFVPTPGEGAFEYDEGMWVWVTAQADSGYRFAGWTGTAASAGKMANCTAASTTVFMDADYAVTANFEIKPSAPPRTLTLSATEGGRVSVPGAGSFTYEEGTTVSVIVQADSGCQFWGWTGSAVDAGKVANPASTNTIVTLDGDYTLCANFVVAGQIGISVASPNGGEILNGGSVVPIQWQVKGPVDRVKIELSLDAGSSWTLVSEQDGKAGACDWLVPTADSNRCLIRIKAAQNGNLFDVSNAPFSIRGVVWYVDAAAKGVGDGTSWQDAFVSLQDGVAASSAGDGIHVAEGSYWPDLGVGQTIGDRAATFQLKDRVAIYGGFPTGGGTMGQRNPFSHRTILTGDIGKTGVSTDNSYHVVTGGYGGNGTILDGCVITRGFANGAEPRDRGAGMYNQGSLIVKNCTFVANTAAGDGAGAFNGPGCPAFVNCVFTGNVSDHWGGGMYNLLSTPTIANCTFSANQAYWQAGGIYSSQGSIRVTNSIFWGNGRMSVLRYDEMAQLICQPAPTINHCCVQGWTGSLAGAGNFGINPAFVDADGPDGIAGTADDDLRLHEGSPCINAGDNAAVPAATATDAQGQSRIAGNAVDVGAYESTEPRS